MLIRRGNSGQRGASMIEALIAIPVVVVACLLTLQLMLLYRAKISLNYATQEAARIGSMNNARVVPRFLTDVTQFSTVFRTRKKCLNSGGGTVANAMNGSCPGGSAEEHVTPGLPTSEIPGSAQSADGAPPTGGQFSGPAGDSAGAPPARPTAGDATSARSGAKGAASAFAKALGRGMLRYGDSSVLQGFINGMAPLYTSGTGFIDVAKGQLSAYGDAMMNSCIVYHSPTQSAFLDFGFMEVDGPDKLVLQIPNDLMRYRVPADVDPKGKHVGYYKATGNYLSDEVPGLRGQLSDMSVQEATLLSIEIMYSYPMKVPIAREILVGLSKLRNAFDTDTPALTKEFFANSLDHGRWPMSGYATYRMQTPVHWHVFYPFGRASNIKSTQIEAFDGIQALWNMVSVKINDHFDPCPSGRTA